jgi:hypothetical protein
MVGWAAMFLLLSASAAWAGPAMLPVRRPPAPVPAYAALAPPGLASPAAGWGLGVTVNGRVVDLESPPELWLGDSSLGERESMAGLGWRSAHASAVLGYGALDFASRAAGSDGGVPALIDASRRRGGAGVIGISLVLRPN